jgi:NAD(P)-dependent dehydrogenase (short-subunit alcohol dehydrogenase family)
VTSKEALQNSVDIITEKHGYINLLICNAGVAPADVPAPALDATSSIKDIRNYFFTATSTEDHSKVLNVNTVGVLLTALAFLELLDEGNKRDVDGRNPRSQVVTTCSAGSFGRSAAFMYNASKAGSLHMMKCLGTFLAQKGIRVNSIAPGCKYFVSFPI